MNFFEIHPSELHLTFRYQEENKILKDEFQINIRITKKQPFAIGHSFFINYYKKNNLSLMAAKKTKEKPVVFCIIHKFIQLNKSTQLMGSIAHKQNMSTASHQII